MEIFLECFDPFSVIARNLFAYIYLRTGCFLVAQTVANGCSFIDSNTLPARLRAMKRVGCKKLPFSKQIKIISQGVAISCNFMDPAKREDHDQQLHEAMAQKGKSKYSGLDIGTKIEIILAWSTTNARFDPSVINSFANQLSEEKQLSPRQVLAVENIIRGFCIPLDE